jgi:hypothetical protein
VAAVGPTFDCFVFFVNMVANNRFPTIPPSHSTILVTSVRSVCVTTTSNRTTTSDPPSTSTRCARGVFPKLSFLSLRVLTPRRDYFAHAHQQLIALPEANVEAPEGTVPVIDLCQLGLHKLVSLPPAPFSHSWLPAAADLRMKHSKPSAR